MAAKIFIFFSAFAIIAAFDNCERCVDGGNKFFLSLSGHASCGKQEFRAQLSAKDFAGCLSLEKLIAKFKIPVNLNEGFFSTIFPTTIPLITSAPPLTTTIPNFESSTEFHAKSNETPIILLQHSTDSTMDSTTTTNMLLPQSAEFPAETTLTPIVLLANSTEFYEETTIFHLQNSTENFPTTFTPQINMSVKLTTSGIPTPTTTAVTRTQPKRCVQTTKTGEDRLNRIWRSAARSYVLIENAKRRNFTLPPELLLWNTLNPVSMMGTQAEEFHRQKLARRRSNTHFVC